MWWQSCEAKERQDSGVLEDGITKQEHDEAERGLEQTQKAENLLNN